MLLKHVSSSQSVSQSLMLSQHRRDNMWPYIYPPSGEGRLFFSVVSVCFKFFGSKPSMFLMVFSCDMADGGDTDTAHNTTSHIAHTHRQPTQSCIGICCSSAQQPSPKCGTNILQQKDGYMIMHSFLPLDAGERWGYYTHWLSTSGWIWWLLTAS